MAEKVALGDSEATQGDDGYAEFTIQGRADFTARIDLFEWQSRIDEYWKENSKKSAREYNDGLVQMMRDAGFPPVSHALAQEFQRHVGRLTGELLKKKQSATAGG